MAAQDRRCQVIFYVSIAVLFTVRLLWTLFEYPILPVQSDSAEWSAQWLYTTVGDYYTAAFCLCGVILATEELWQGIGWCLALLLLGAPFGCAYLIVASLRYHGLALASDRPGAHAELERSPTPCTQVGLPVAYGVLGLSFAIRLAWTLVAHPILPLQTGDADWAFQWLLTTVGDYYTVTLCLCGIILSTEGLVGCIWCLASLLLGAPFSCAYVVFRLVANGTLSLSSEALAAYDSSSEAK